MGPQLLRVYTSDAAVIQCGMEILLYTTVTYFMCGLMDLFPGALRGMGFSAVPMLLSVIGTVGTRIPKTSFFRCTFYFLPCIMVSYHCITSNLLLFCAEKAQKSHRDG